MSQQPPSRRVFLAAGAATAVAAAAARAGPLVPPAGPVSPTDKPTGEIEPRINLNAMAGDGFHTVVINQPGSYYLTGDLVGVPNRDAIGILAANVTIDLNGFSLIGGSPSGFSSTGISFNFFRCVIRNGSIRGFAYGLLGAGADNLFEDLIIEASAGALEHSSQRSIFRRIRCTGQGEIGISAGNNSLVEDCVVEGNFFTAINCARGSIVRNCTVRNLGVTGSSKGIYGTGGLITGCTVNGHAYGASMLTGMVRRSTFAGATSAALLLQRDATIEGNTFVRLAAGVSADSFTGTRSWIRGNAFAPASPSAPGVAITGARTVITGNHFVNTATPVSAPAGNAVGAVQTSLAVAGPWDNLSL